MDVKRCKGCDLTKGIDCFTIDHRPKAGKSYIKSKCKECCAKNTAENRRKNPNSSREYYIKNKEKILSQTKKYKTNNKAKVRLQNSKWESAHKKERAKQKKEQRQKNPHIKLNWLISGLIVGELKKRNVLAKNKEYLKYLPYTLNELKTHLETHPEKEDWMNWNTHGKYSAKTWDDNDSSTWTWNIDHIIPRSKLPYDSFQHPNFKKCWALENLRPYSAKQNCIDGDRRSI